MSKNLFKTTPCAVIATLFLTLPAASLAAAGTGDGSSAADAIDIAQSDITDTSSYWDGTNSHWSIDGGLYYVNSGQLDFGTESTGDDLYVGDTTKTYLTISGGTSGTDYTVRDYCGSIGDASGSSGEVTVTGEYTKWVNSDCLYIGYEGTGVLTIKAGAYVSDTGARIGSKSSGNGTVTVTGSGSKWINSDTMVIGRSGTGTLNIEDGGYVSSDSESFIGYNSGSNGTVTVTGSGSKWIINNSSNLIVGVSGTGTLNIEKGGNVSDNVGYIGYNSGSNGTVTVTGSDSKWINSGALQICSFGGTGKLTISDGGYVSNSAAYIGLASDSNGTVTVTGSGSQWINSSSLYVGYSGTGALTIADGGLVTASSVSVGENDGSGTIYIDGGYLAVAGALDSDAITALLSGIEVGTSDSSVSAVLNKNIYCVYLSSSGTVDTITGYSLDGYTVFYTTAVPEPATWALFGAFGALGMALCAKRKRA